MKELNTWGKVQSFQVLANGSSSSFFSVNFNFLFDFCDACPFLFTTFRSIFTLLHIFEEFRVFNFYPPIHVHYFCLHYFGAVFLSFPSSLLFLYLVTLPPVLLASELYWRGMITCPHGGFYFLTLTSNRLFIWTSLLLGFYFLLLHLTTCLFELSFYLFYFSLLFQVFSCSFPLSLIISSTARLKCLQYLKAPPGES